MGRTIYLVISLVLGAVGAYMLLMLFFGGGSIPVGAAGAIILIFWLSVAALVNALVAVVVFLVLRARARRGEPGIQHAVRDATCDDLERVLALNRAHTPEVGEVDANQMLHLFEQAAWCLVAEHNGEITGFLIALTEDADYQSPNFTWFKERYERFAYIDRVAVTSPHRRQGLATLLYCEVVQQAAERGIQLLACEYNLRPPNPVSASFHNRNGFEEVGIQDTEQGTKTVSLQLKSISGA